MIKPPPKPSKRPYIISRNSDSESRPLNPQGIEHLAPRRPSRLTSFGSTARRIVSGPKKPTLVMPPPVSSRDHWYGPTVEIRASPRPRPIDVEECATCPYRAVHLEPNHRVRTKLSRGQIGSFRRPSVLPKSPRHPRRVHRSRSYVRLADPPRSTLKSSETRPERIPIPPSPSPTLAPKPSGTPRTRLHSLPSVVRRYAPSCVTAVEEEQRIPERLSASTMNRPLPPLPPPSIRRKPVPTPHTPSEDTRPSEPKKTVMFDFAPVKGFTPKPIMSSSSDDSGSVKAIQDHEVTPVPSFIKVGNQKLADFEDGKSLYDELREVLGLRGLCLTRADLAFEPPSPLPSPAPSEASLPLTPMSTIFADASSPEILVDVSIDMDPVTPTRTPHTPPSQTTLHRFSRMAFEDQFQEIFDVIERPIVPALVTNLSPSDERLIDALPPPTPRVGRAQEPKTPQRSTLLHVSSLRAQVGTTSPAPAPTRQDAQPATKWQTRPETGRFVPSGLNHEIRKKRIPSGPRALSGMSSDEWLKKKEIKRADGTRAARDSGPEHAGPSRLTTTPVSRLGNILSQEPLVNSAELSIQGRNYMREARRKQHAEI